MTVTLLEDRAQVEFRSFGLDAYDLFLRAKQLPESRLAYDWRTDTYTIDAPARFASILDAGLRWTDRAELPLAGHLFDYQRFIVEQALAARRYAIWADTGLGKTAMLLEFARQVVARTGGRCLLLSPLQVIEQTRAEAVRFYGQDLPIERLPDRDALADWCEHGTGLAITNPEKLIPGVLPELRGCAGVVLDESSLLKSGGGVIKWNLIKSARGIEYKLSCTATPAPNDTMEYASQASFLEKLRDGDEILWTFFTRDKSGDWRVKPHAREAFYRFMASWSIYLRDPASYGWTDILSTLPPPEVHEYRLDITAEQRDEMHALQVEQGSGMFSTHRMGVRERARLSQLAKGFLYGPGKVPRRVDSAKPAFVADLVRAEVDAGRPALVWTVFDEESVVVAEELRARGVEPSVLEGSTPPAERLAILDAFRSGGAPVLVSKAQLVGYGLNFQHCRAMVFSGFDDSFERMYQAIRRAYRFGQTETVHVHVPYVPELEGMIFDNVRAKQGRFEADAAACEQHYRAAILGEAA